MNLDVYVDPDSAVVTLLGLPILPEEGDAEAPCVILLDPDTAYEAPNGSRTFLEYAVTPRPETELRAWLAERGESPDLVSDLVQAGRVRLVGPGTPTDVLVAFEGLVLRPNCVPLEWPSDVARSGYLMWVGDPRREADGVATSGYLAIAMWDRQSGEDLPATLRRLASQSDRDVDEFLRELLPWLPPILAAGYAYLGPRQAQE